MSFQFAKGDFRHSLSKTEIAILGGGLSSRMGRDKGRIKLGSEPLLDRATRIAASTGLPVKVIRKDLVERCGPLGGVVTAFTQSESEAIVFLACDMPFVSAELIQRLVAEFRRAR